MKKIFKFASVVLAIALTGACAKQNLYEPEQVTELEPGLVPMTLTATLDLGKATIDGLDVKWETGDKIAVFDGVAKREFTLAGGAGTTTAFFSGAVDAGATEFYAVSPFAAATSFTAGTFTLNLPSQQTIAAGKVVDPKALVQVGKVDGSSLALKNVFSRSSFTVNEDGIKSLTFIANGTEKIAGSATCGVDAVATAASSGVNTIRAISADEGGFARGTYYIALLPATLESGFKASLSTEETIYFCSTANSIEFARNGGKNIGDIIANPGVIELPVGISTGAELKLFVDNADVYGSDITVYLKNDIDMTEVSSTWSNPKPFYCKFDGKNFAIKNFNITGSGDFGILGDAHGDVKDVTFGVKDGSESITVTGDDGTVQANVAPITAALGTASITNVKNYASVLVAADAPNATNIAGIVGNMASSGNLENCYNYGAVDAKNNVAEWLDLGGITGSMSGTGKITTSYNYGALSYTGSSIAKTINIGGIAAGSSRGTVENCENYGTITVSNTVSTSADINLGGVIGFNNGAMTAINKCFNKAEGDITIDSKSTAGVTNVGGIVGKVTVNTTITECENYGDITRGTSATSAGNVNLGGLAGMANTASPKFVTCTNNGDVYNGGTTGTMGDFGGLVGDMASGSPELSGCVNNGDVTNTASVSGKYFQISGIAAVVKSACKITDCTNNGAISNSGNLTNLCIGGIVGENGGTAYKTFSGNTNTGAVSNTGTIATRYCMGGITGRAAVAATYTSCTNSGAVSATGPSSSGDVKAGGIVGENTVKCTYDKCKNNAPVSAANVAKNVVLGGIVADITANGAIFKDCKNLENGAISVNATSAIGQAFVGGILGRTKGTSVPVELTTCSNSGDVTLEAPGASSYRYVGGIVGDLDNGSAKSKVTSCTNSGVVTYKTAINNANGCRFGGVVGNSVSSNTIASCTNSGDVVNESASTNPHFGGVLGYASGVVTIKDCICTSDAHIQQKGNAQIVNMGGIQGATGGAGSIENCKSAAVIEKISGTVTTVNAHQIEGGSYNDQKLASVKNNGVGGSVLGTAVTGDNFASYISATGTPVDCYFWDGTL